MSEDILRTMAENKALFAALLEEAGVEEPDVFDTKTFFVQFYYATMRGASVDSALREAIDGAKEVLANPSKPRPPLTTRSYLNWRDEDRVRQGLPPITDNGLPQRGAFPPAPAHLRWNQN